MRPATIAIAIVLSASGVRAQENNARTFSLNSTSAEACPAVTSFSARILARTTRAAVAPAGSAETEFSLVVDADPEGASGKLEVRSGGSSSVRKVRGASCEEVVEALALVAALILDPNASTGPIEALKPEAPPPESPGTKSTTPPSQQQPVSPTSQQPRALEPARTSEQPGPPWRFGAGMRALLTQGVAPDPVVGIGTFVSALLDTEQTVFEPLLMIGISYAKSGGYDAAVDGEQLGTARFRWIAVEISGCPVRFPVSGEVAARPCMGFEAGRLTGTGQAPKNAAEETAPWVAITAGLKIDWTLFDLLRLDLTAGGFLSLSRDEFFFETLPGSTTPSRGVVVHEIPAVGARASLGVGFVLPPLN